MNWVFMIALFLTGNSFAQEAPAGDVKRGHAAFLKYQCYTCHGTVGQGADRGAGPKLAPNPFPWAGFEFQVRTPRQDMPPYRKQHLPDQDLADIYTYVRTIKAPPSASSIPLLKAE
jgi:ubiquinol-cytochrome c reductase cytochrome c subunit